MKTVLLKIEYDGSDFSGWARQPGQRTVQGELEQVLSTLCRCDISLNGTGRTDAGVHAMGQTASFSGEFNIPVDNLVKAANDILAESRFKGGDVRIVSACEVSEGFHARFDAKGKTYTYMIRNSAQIPVFLRNYRYNVKKKLDVDAMQAAIAHFKGTHDFATFMAAGGTPQNSTVRTIYGVQIAAFDCMGTAPPPTTASGALERQPACECESEICDCEVGTATCECKSDATAGEYGNDIRFANRNTQRQFGNTAIEAYNGDERCKAENHDCECESEICDCEVGTATCECKSDATSGEYGNDIRFANRNTQRQFGNTAIEAYNGDERYKAENHACECESEICDCEVGTATCECKSDATFGEYDCDIAISITGDGFLYNMVRIIVGTLVDVGLGRIAADKIPDIIAGCDRQLAGHTAPPQGLYMQQVYFSEEELLAAAKEAPNLLP